jgi:threonine dehydrogenase-like Zn-dependent dehydrogenase
VDRPKLSKSGAILRVRACGICGSDLHLYKLAGQWVPTGMILGHEFSGDVVEVGEEVKDLRVGDRVMAMSFQPCYECAMCKAGQHEWCARGLTGGLEIPGAFAEYVSLPYPTLDKKVFRLADGISYEEGALLDPVAVGYMGVARGNPLNTDAVVVFGAGAIGLSCIVALKALGVARIIVSETSGLRLQAAGSLGADILINASEDDVAARIAEATGGAGPDIAIECTGVKEPFFTALNSLRPDGKLVQAGIFTESFEFNPLILTLKWLTITSYIGGDYPAATAAINGRLADFKRWVTHVYPLEQINEAFAMQARTGESIKVVVKP